jgi:hypothetical protein
VAKLEKKNANQQKMEETLKAARKKKIGKSTKNFRIGKESRKVLSNGGGKKVKSSGKLTRSHHKADVEITYQKHEV